MSKWLLGACIALLSAALVVPEAEARRFGGARSLGAQRTLTPPSKPAQQQAAPAKPSQPAQAQGQGRWGGILGGLALGGLLGWLFAGNGLGGLVLLALLAVGIALVLRTMAQRAQAPRAELAGIRGASVPATQAVREAGGAPAGFDTAGFLRAAKRNFLRLQVANDAGRLDEIRELVTDEMFEALKADADERGAEIQHTEVLDLDAQLLELAAEGDAHWASVRFSGRVSEAGEAPQPFGEVWNLVKPVDGSSGWLLAGIQQMH